MQVIQPIITLFIYEKNHFFVIILLFIGFLPINIYAQCNPDDTVESWYGWFKGLRKLGDRNYVPISEADEMIVGDSVHLEMTKEFKLVRGYEKQAILENIVRKLTQHVERKGIKYTIHVIQANPKCLCCGRWACVCNDQNGGMDRKRRRTCLCAGSRNSTRRPQTRYSQVQKMMLGQTFGGDYGKMAAQIENVLTAPFGQIDEYEADREGAILVNKAGYNPRKGLRFFEKMGEKENYSIYEKVVRTHPYSAERMKCLDSFLREELNK